MVFAFDPYLQSARQEPSYGLCKTDKWTHIFRLPEEFWNAYCGATIDWKATEVAATTPLCPYCLVLWEDEHAKPSS